MDRAILRRHYANRASLVERIHLGLTADDSDLSFTVHSLFQEHGRYLRLTKCVMNQAVIPSFPLNVEIGCKCSCLCRRHFRGVLHSPSVGCVPTRYRVSARHSGEREAGVPLRNDLSLWRSRGSPRHPPFNLVLRRRTSSLTSSSLCSHSLLWRKVLECSSSHCSLRYPCDLTLMEEGSGVFFLTLLTSSSLCSHTHDLSSHPSHRYP